MPAAAAASPSSVLTTVLAVFFLGGARGLDLRGVGELEAKEVLAVAGVPREGAPGRVPDSISSVRVFARRFMIRKRPSMES